jgi:hypothetical protein
MQIPLPRSFRYKISIHSREQNTQNTNIGPEYLWIKKYDTRANYIGPQNFIKVMNPLNFGVSLVNPYHIFQIRKMPQLSCQMKISKGTDWFKVKDISRHSKIDRFLNIVAIPLPSEPIPLLESSASDEVFSFLQSILCKIKTTLAELVLHDSQKCEIYLEEQENVNQYPCIILRINFLRPYATALPSYEFGFAINAIGYNQTFMILLASKCVATINVNAIAQILPKVYSEKSFGTTNSYQYKIRSLDHVETFWDTTEDRFSIRAQIKYQGTISLEKATIDQSL